MVFIVYRSLVLASISMHAHFLDFHLHLLHALKKVCNLNFNEMSAARKSDPPPSFFKRMNELLVQKKKKHLIMFKFITSFPKINAKKASFRRHPRRKFRSNEFSRNDLPRH